MQQKETLSAYMDGENVQAEFSRTLCNNEALQQTWAKYHTIRSLMRGEELLLGKDFSDKMADLIEAEQIVPAKKGLLLTLKGWTTPIMQAGIAASVCFIAILGVNTWQGGEDEAAQAQAPVRQTLPFSDSVRQVSYNTPTIEPTAEQLEYQQQRINALLQNHELQRRTQTTVADPKQKAADNTQQMNTDTAPKAEPLAQPPAQE